MQTQSTRSSTHAPSYGKLYEVLKAVNPRDLGSYNFTPDPRDCITEMVQVGPGAVYFTQRLFRGNVQPSDEAGQGIVKLYSALNSTDTKGSLIDYEIAAILGGEDGVNYNMAFSVNRSGWINLEDPDVFIKSQGNQVTLHVEARAGVETPSTSVEVQVTFNDPADIPCADACFWESISSLYAEENSEAMVLGRLGINLRHMACQHVDLTYQITNFHVPSLQVPNLDPKDWLYLNNRSSEIALVTSLDREAWEIANISVTCLVKYRNGSAERREQSLDLTVSDVDDSPPVLRNHRSTIQLDRKQWNLVKRNKSLSLVVADNDTAGSYDYEVFLRKNEHGWFSVLKPKIFQLKSSGRWKSTALRAEILMVADEKPPGVISSNFEVVFLDKLYQKARHSPLRGEVVVEVEVKLTEQKTADRVVHDQYTANISQQAAKFSEVELLYSSYDLQCHTSRENFLHSAFVHLNGLLFEPFNDTLNITRLLWLVGNFSRN
ncbi:uncharacterized protein LOC135467098 [Liolophura sinensis]|uniref:uncharacterized protein LOC135467098 n=1 Tax=Liolophura sinensis TaxID=3198878 RepID=UPI003157FA98